MDPVPELGDTKDFGIDHMVYGADGSQLAYCGYIKDPYVVIDIPIAGIPVFKVQKESDSAVVKTLHRNLLLPFSAIPRTDQVEGILPSKPVKQGLKTGKAMPKPVIQISESEHSSDSEQEEVSLFEVCSTS